MDERIDKLKFHQKLHFRIVMLLLFIFLTVSGVNFYLIKKSYSDLEKDATEIACKNISDVKKIVNENLIKLSEQAVTLLTQKIFFEQLAFLKSRDELKDLKDLKDAKKLIDFCINSKEYQEIYNLKDSLAKYSYITVSIYDIPRLVLVSHNKKDIIGVDIFELVKKLSPEDRAKQQTEKFISHWVNKESGGIYYEQTKTFKDASIPADYNKKYSYQYWGKFNGIDIVVEYATYINEIMTTVKAIDKKHLDTISMISARTSESFGENFKFIIYVLSGIMIFLIFLLLAFSRKYILTPINNIVDGLKRFGEGKFREPMKANAPGEFGIICDASNVMAAKLAETLDGLEKINESLEHKVEQRTSELAESKKIIEAEKEKSETLIKNILPAKIAEQLKENPDQVIAKEHAMVSIIFTDFKGFTTMSESTTPIKLVRELNEIFAYFDDLCAKFNIEKIKTIGDAYMAVGGLPESNETHPADAVEMALAMRDHIIARSKDAGNLPLEIRIGIHSGPVIAGVIGRKRFVYDIWGDSVNIASRMESNSLPGKVNISSETYKLVKDKYKCEKRGEVEIKGKGPMTTYFIERA